MQKRLLHDYGKHVDASTIRKILKQEGLKAIAKVKKPYLKPQHKRHRLEFANEYKYWTVEDWKRVIWSDETKINRFGSDGLKWAWKKPGTTLQKHHTVPVVKFGGGSFMIWGCITSEGIGYMCRIDGNMNAELYKNILEEELLQTIDYYNLKRDETIFQHDNDSKHRLKLVINWVQNEKIKVLDWPAQSPDLNPIENLWSILKRRLNDYEEIPKSMYQLWERIETEWNKINKEICLKIIQSMAERIHAVLKSKGGHTKFCNKGFFFFTKQEKLFK